MKSDLTIRLLGITESMAREKLKDLMDTGMNPCVEPYVKEEDIILMIKAEADTEEEAVRLIKPVKNIIRDRFGIKCYAEGDDVKIEDVVGDLLIKNKLTISTAESCTGGMIAARLVNYPGISDAFAEGAVTYANEAKMRTLNVRKETLDTVGAVSEETAREMAVGIAERSGSDISVVTTGIAGPGGGTKEKPVGLVYIGVYYKGKVKAYRHVFTGNRLEVRTKAAVEALDKVRIAILEDNIE